MTPPLELQIHRVLHQARRPMTTTELALALVYLAGLTNPGPAHPQWGSYVHRCQARGYTPAAIARSCRTHAGIRRTTVRRLGSGTVPLQVPAWECTP